MTANYWRNRVACDKKLQAIRDYAAWAGPDTAADPAWAMMLLFAFMDKARMKPRRLK